MTEKAVRGGSFCGPVGAVAKTSAGTDVTCTLGDGQRQARWRSTDGRRAPRRSRATAEPRRQPTILEMNRRQLRAAAQAAGIQLKRGEPDDAIRSKLSDHARAARPALVDARPVEPVTPPAVQDAIAAGAVGEVGIYCDGTCGTEYRGDFTGETRADRFAAARAYLATQGWKIGDLDLCPACGAKHEASPAPTTEELPTVTEPTPAADAYGVADYRQPLTDFERQAGVVEPVVDVTRRTTRAPKLAWEDSQNGMFHTNSVSADALRGLGEDTKVDMGGGVPLQDLITDVAMATGSREISAAEAPARYRAIAARLPEGSRARRMVENLAAEVDGPPVEPLELPADVDPAVRDLVRTVEGLPAFRNPDNLQCYRAYEKVREIGQRAAGGATRRQVRTELYRLYNTVHEMNFDRGSEEFNRALAVAEDALQRRPAQGA